MLTLSYDVERDFVPGVKDQISDFKEAGKIDIELVVANDFRLEVTSNMQTNFTGETVFLPVKRSNGNISDGSNQQVVRFQYGLPTANEIMGFTFEVSELGGFNLRSEFNVNRHHRKFPNQNIVKRQALASDRAEAFYVTASRLSYPWFAYGEAFSMDPNYGTAMVIPDQRGFIDYEDELNFSYEFVDDNDDQDRFPTGGGALPEVVLCRGSRRPAPPMSRCSPASTRTTTWSTTSTRTTIRSPITSNPFCATMSIRPNFSSAPT